MKIKQALKSNVVNGKIDELIAIEIAEKADALLNESLEMLNKLKKQVGMFLGGEIGELQAKIKGEVFNERTYNYERLPDGQE